ncbi:DMT family transporter [Shimia thalassica]|jgi:drug/metabolite transporter (DMT)-like permease|uniref:DMT family transporter n=1 Tax=Shimia thalassica TaxID=1715693 RepID=UPI0026E2CEF2|nr:DMT family transporter [Shimia thalassica]MDO6479922.1 DMT family transporter [Shimia thalassica]
MTDTPQRPALAALLTVTASGFVAGTTLLAKAVGTGVLGPALSPLQISQGRFLFAFLAFSLAAAILRPTFTRPHLGYHFGRSGLGWGGVTLMFAAATFIPLSDATAISFLNPVFAMVFAIPFLGERVGPWRWGSAALAFIGAMILTRPSAGTLQAGALLALMAALMMGGEMIFIKLLSRREKPFQILLINNAIGLAIASLAAVFVWQSPAPLQWAALAGIGLLMASAQTCFINAMRLADASFVSPIFYTTLAFATLYDAVIFDVIPDHITLLGATLILGSAAILAWRETRRK